MRTLSQPRRWTAGELEQLADRSRMSFIEQREKEGIAPYLQAFDRYADEVGELLAQSNDLLDLKERASSLLAQHPESIRYLASPAISMDDLKTLARIKSLTRASLTEEGAHRAVDVIGTTVDARRFPWVREGRRPTGEERRAAVIATAALMANQRSQTDRRNAAKTAQESQVRAYLVGELGFVEEPRRPVRTMGDAPGAGTFYGESLVASTKADFVVGLYDGRFLALECKVSNSSANSFKRLNHEALEKVMAWDAAFGKRGVVGAAVLAGVFSLDNLMAAQDEGAALFWSCDLSSLGEFIASTAER